MVWYEKLLHDLFIFLKVRLGQVRFGYGMVRKITAPFIYFGMTYCSNSVETVFCNTHERYFKKHEWKII